MTVKIKTKVAILRNSEVMTGVWLAVAAFSEWSEIESDGWVRLLFCDVRHIVIPNRCWINKGCRHATDQCSITKKNFLKNFEVFLLFLTAISLESNTLLFFKLTMLLKIQFLKYTGYNYKVTFYLELKWYKVYSCLRKLIMIEEIGYLKSLWCPLKRSVTWNSYDIHWRDRLLEIPMIGIEEIGYLKFLWCPLCTSSCKLFLYIRY